MPKHLIAALLIVASSYSFAADPNGYTAKYEKTIGTPPQCSVTISSSSDPNWAKLNDPAYPVICIAPGDYTSRGTIMLSAKGTTTAKRWLRYVRSSDSNDLPWRQDPSNRAVLDSLNFSGGAHWIVHRLTLDGSRSVRSALVLFSDNTNANENVIDSVLVEHGANDLVHIGWANADNTIQNSVLRDCRISSGTDSVGVGHFGAVHTRTVNNEIYGCVKAIYISQHVAPGTVVENNDLYVPSSLYTDCGGNYRVDGTCSTTESVVGTKNGGTSSEPVKMIHNRIWGNRKSDTTLCCAGGGGQGSLAFIGGQNATADPNTTGAKYTLFQNNILLDSQIGIASYWGGVRNNTFLGNIIYNIHRFNSSVPSHAIGTGSEVSSQIYLNTIIDSDSWIALAGGADNDARCNVVLNSGKGSISIGTNTHVENNAFFAASPFTTGSTADDVVSSSPSDAKAGDVCFYRKLRTGPERVCIPYSKPSNISPHLKSCKSTIGQRLDIGVTHSYPMF